MDDKDEEIYIEVDEALLETQPNSQNTTTTEKSQAESQALAVKEPWGRLFKKRVWKKSPGQPTPKTVLKKDDERDYLDVRGLQFRFGRDPQCEFRVKKNDGIDLKTWNRISKTHFMLTKDIYSDDAPVVIKDLSQNGTYLNGELIGRNEQRVMKNGDVISIVMKDLKIFVFQDLTPRKLTNLPEKILDRYFVQRKIGSGAFGEVYKLLDRKLNPYAVKYIKGYSVAVNQTNQVTDNEIKIMLALKHVCIIRTVDIIKDPFGGASLILEYMDGGDLLSRIINSRLKRLSEDEARCVMYQVTDAINYLHRKGITHRDIKPDNILCKDKSSMTLVKITDFGLSKLVTEGTCMTSLLGTPNYVAPEILHEAVTKYSSKVDVWSMGVMLFAMLSGTLPFADEYGDVRNQIISGEYQFIAECWREMSRDAIRLIRQMLVVNPNKRINTRDILETNWMDAKFEGVKNAKILIVRNGGSISSMQGTRHKENEFALPKPPKRARLH